MARDVLNEELMTPQPTTWIKALWGTFLGAITAPEIGPEKAFTAFIVLQFFDWLTGVWAASREGTPISSARARQGAYKKGMMWVYIAVAGIALWVAPISGQSWRLAWSAVFAAFSWIEIISICENGDRLGLPLPPVVRRLLAGLRPSDAIAELPPETKR